MEKLEQILYDPVVLEPKRRQQVYRTSDLEQLSVIVLYTGDIGGFKIGSFGNIFTNYDLGKLTGDASLKGWTLQERFDFKNLEKPHINYGITGPKGGYLSKILGDAHKIDLKFK